MVLEGKMCGLQEASSPHKLKVGRKKEQGPGWAREVQRREVPWRADPTPKNGDRTQGRLLLAYVPAVLVSPSAFVV